ncbi:hAT family dimerization protein (macronuclear) [Tetrahymena thermophila SB210]|uniref:HAT family dimerization protein n=1 Tax=Tetrahymena thermophila (strain SB210) TaxID=312017 RepID=Q233K2_TETTS|nr:hAT family dimerization protein [Tetrahymena thermophila SB210]EAR91578.1 hAT family dimerization protein [Tetrahymena thermophila SB210]|eukprot:XP_001011823.1 hAT family dimerization protein [Tetrahymena thermophila SB210]
MIESLEDELNQISKIKTIENEDNLIGSLKKLKIEENQRKEKQIQYYQMSIKIQKLLITIQNSRNKHLKMKLSFKYLRERVDNSLYNTKTRSFELEFYYKNQNTYPNLTLLAKKYFVLQATTAEQESKKISFSQKIKRPFLQIKSQVDLSDKF